MDSTVLKDLSLEAMGTGVLFVLGLIRGWWVMGSELKRLQSEVDYWRGKYAASVVGVSDKEKST